MGSAASASAPSAASGSAALVGAGEETVDTAAEPAAVTAGVSDHDVDSRREAVVAIRVLVRRLLVHFPSPPPPLLRPQM